MKFRSFLLNLIIGFSALLFGLAWVGIYQFFVGGSTENNVETCGVQPESKSIFKFENTTFDINNPESVLPIDFEEDKLSDPKEDENNPEYFDPEGTYFALDKLPSEFGSFESFTINKKNLEYDESGNYKVEDVSLRGFVFDTKMHKFENLEVNDGMIRFNTKETATGVSFSFEGEFLVKGNFYTLNEKAEVVRGTLTKTSGNKKTVLHDFNFGWTIDFE